MSNAKKRKKVISDAFRCHGVDLPEGATEGNQQCDCPFCGKENHFFVNAEDGRWDCKFCHENGNLYTFLAKYSSHVFEQTPAAKFRQLSEQRGLPAKVFRRHRLGWDGQQWLIPTMSDKGTVRDIRRWAGKGVMSTDFCKLQLYGLYELSRSTVHQTVWLCEGEWDAMALRWLLDNCNRKLDIVVAVPGAGTFMEDWVPFFAKRDVICCYDNDDAGDRGAEKSEMMLGGTARQLRFVNWPDTLAPGYDMRDLVKDAIADGTSMRDTMQVLEGMIAKRRRRETTAGSPSREGAAPSSGGRTDETPISFAEVLKVFHSWCRMDDHFENGLAISLAICLSNEVPGDPVWLYLVGPPGSGKTVILSALNDSDRTCFYSSLTPASLVSGFNTHPDPSLLPRINGKTAIFKDGTELLALHPDARREAYGTLRGAYDGSVYRPFGNGVVRDYRDLHFNVIIGITPAVHGDNQAAMGERLIKYEMREDQESVNTKIMKAMDNIAQEQEMGQELATACRRFLLRPIDPARLPKISMEYLTRIAALAQIVSMLRAQVDRESYGDREVKFRPVHETGTRIAKQLAKLARMLCIVYDMPEVGPKIYRLIRQVAMDTGTGYHVDIVRAIMSRDNPGLTRDQICEAAKMSRGVASRRLEDLEHLGILRRSAGQVRIRASGTTPQVWLVSDQMAGLWRTAWAKLPEDLPQKAGVSPRAAVAAGAGTPKKPIARK